jgi:PIN domain nuclease of toxin-antitoxin system
LKHLENEIVVSAASVYEIGQKVRRGKLPEAAEFEQDLLRNIEARGYTVLALQPEIMLRAARFQSPHADPFDRMIAAHAIHRDIPVLSIDPSFDGFGIRRIDNQESTGL